MKWDDIRIFLSVARTEKLSEAAKQLSIDSSTVSRRLHGLEESLKTKLFERTLDGHHLTNDGKTLLNAAHKMEQQAIWAYDKVMLDNAEHAGLVKIGLTEAFGSYFIAPNFVEFHRQYPDIKIDFLQFNRDVKISRNEADIAISIVKPKNASLIVQTLSNYQLQLYASHRYIEENPPISQSNLAHQRWTSYVDDLLFTEQLSFNRDLQANITPNYRSTSVTSQYALIKSGIAIGILPCFMADQDPNLVKVCPSEINIERTFYLITHPENKRLSRVNIVWHYLKTLTEQQQHLLMPN